MKRVLSLPVEMELNTFSGPAPEATDDVAVICGCLRSIRSRSSSGEEGDLLSGCCDDGFAVSIPLGAAHLHVVSSPSDENKGFCTIL